MSADKLKAAFAAWVKKNGIVVNGKQELQKIFEHFMKIVVLPQAQAAGGQVLGGSDGHHYEIPDDHETHMVNDGSTVQIVDVDHDGNKTYMDDWQQLLRNRAKASIGPNGEMLDDFDQEFELGQIKTADAQAVAPPTNTNPPSSITAILGGSVTLQAGAAGTNPVPSELARWQGDDTETTNVTVTIGPALSQSAITGAQVGVHGQARPFALVQWGTRGISMQAKVDATRGAQFTIGASYVSLSMGMESLSAPGFAVKAIPTLLSGMLSFRVVNSPAKITSTVYVDLPDTTPLIPIPNFADSFWITSDFGNVAVPGGNYPFLITFYDPGQLTPLGGTILVPYDTGSAKYIMIPSNAAYMQIVPTTPPSGVIDLQVIFGLNL